MLEWTLMSGEMPSYQPINTICVGDVIDSKININNEEVESHIFLFLSDNISIFCVPP